MAKLRALGLICGLAFLPLIAAGQTKPAGEAGTTLSPAAREKIVRQAEQAYYNLHAHGLSEFRCQASPDWDAIYKDATVDAVGRDQLLPTLKRSVLKVLVGPTGASSISFESDDAPQSEDVADRMRRTIAGIDQVLTGFFQTWSEFAITSPFPAASGDYQLEEVGDKYRLTQKDSSADTITVMNHDFAIEKIQDQGTKVNGSVEPALKATKDGLLLTGYTAKATAAQDQPQQEVSVKISYQEVQGFQLPQLMNASVGLPGGPQLAMPVSFTNCQVKRQ